MIISRLHALIDSPFGAVLGGAVYGAWAFAVNHHAGAENAWLIGLSHWSLSTFLTFFGVRIMRICYGFGRWPLMSVGFSFAGSMVFTYVLLISVHTFLGTPEILLTLAPGILPTVGFAGGYSLLLYREERLDNGAQAA
ncbi:MAG: hypothetical protein OXT49_08805 [Gammaproteobacteria bacterium]|nr:hypothetical protein [Gammaproteobacteria bacterium]